MPEVQKFNDWSQIEGSVTFEGIEGEGILTTQYRFAANVSAILCPGATANDFPKNPRVRYGLLIDAMDDGHAVTLYRRTLDIKGQLQGAFIETYPDGSLKARGRYEDGKRQGVWKFSATDPQKSHQAFDTDMLVGFGTTSWDALFMAARIRRECNQMDAVCAAKGCPDIAYTA